MTASPGPFVAGSLPGAAGEPPWNELSWDSRHFGFRVGRLRADSETEAELRVALTAASQAGIGLLYWTTPDVSWQGRPVIADFGGKAVAQRVTFESAVETVAEAAARGAAGDVAVSEYPDGDASVRLQELALIASQHSRFRRDNRLPTERCDALYRLWAQRSTRREIADVVLTAAARGVEVAGFITVAVDGDVGEIGLVAVAPESQGQGVGRALVAAAAGWMEGRGLRLARVTTQGENLAAVRLYRGTGFTGEHWETDYHFWLASHDG